ncbi:alpha/beta hydrolase [Modestobacter sp. NPDC049651]|uniref:alpha/beta hydrolase n=1 Tax=unclassified Modestobacter TaxID=2643866 RepID=UPI0033FE08C8
MPSVLGGLLLALLVVLTGCTSGDAEDGGSNSAAASSSAPKPAIDWQDCTQKIQPIIAGRPGSDRGFTFSCGTTEVPVSYADPGGDTMQLFMVRAALGNQTNRIGSLLVNPGGPGGAATDAAIQSALTLPADVVNRFDIVGVDPRGVGLSTPVECISDQQKDAFAAADPRAVDEASLTQAFDLADEIGKACTKKYGAALGAFNTVATARDMDRVRQALGEDQLTYLGYSYGTTLGSTYAQLFPEQVRALVLDGAVDPDGTPQESAETQAQGFEQAYDAFAANCTALVGGCPVGGDPRGFLTALLDQADATPIPSSKAGETRTATAGLVLGGVQAALYQPDAWPQLAQSLAAAQRGDSAGILTLADTFSGRNDDGSYTNITDANAAINCADTKDRYTRAQVSALATDWNQKYPLFGANAALSLYTCTSWKAPKTALPHEDAAGAAPVLVIGTQGDPVTPLPGAVDMAEELSSGVLLTWQGSGHTAYPKTDCVTRAVDAYLVDLTVPTDGLTCPAA